MARKSTSPHVPEMNWTIFLNLAFGVIELIGGLLTNSVMLLTDAVHDLGDSLALFVALVLDRDASRGKSRNFTYGYKRLALFSAFIASMIMLVAAAIMMPYALRRLFNPESINVIPVIWLALLGCIVHAVSILNFKSGRAKNKKLAFYNLVEDLVGWLAVLAAALVILIFDVKILDPIMSLVMIAFMLMTSMRNFYVVLLTFLQGVPANIDIDKVAETILALPYINEMSDFHVWTLNGEENVGTVILKIDKDLTWRRRTSIKKNVRAALKKAQVDFVTIEFDETKGEMIEADFK